MKMFSVAEVDVTDTILGLILVFEKGDRHLCLGIHVQNYFLNK